MAFFKPSKRHPCTSEKRRDTTEIAVARNVNKEEKRTGKELNDGKRNTNVGLLDDTL